MKITNFVYKGKVGNSVTNYKFYATIDVTTGFFKKKTETKRITKEFAGSWFFIETGEFTPDYTVETFCRAYEAQQGENLKNMTLEYES